MTRWIREWFFLSMLIVLGAGMLFVFWAIWPLLPTRLPSIMLPALSLLQNVILPMDFANKYSTKERRERAMDLLELVGLADQAQKLPSMVSGGQQQRAAIARALANDPPLLVGDEPTGNLDSRTAGDVFDLFSQLVESGKTMLMVTHDKELAERVPRRIEITNGRITRDEQLATWAEADAQPHWAGTA